MPPGPYNFDFDLELELELQAQRQRQGQGTPTWGDTAISTGLRVVPSIGGALVGGALSAPTGPGAIAGVAAGGAAGAGLGEGLAQWYEASRGLRDGISPTEIATETALGAIPLGRTATLGRAIRQGSLMGGGSEIARSVINEGELPELERFLAGTALGGAFGGATDAAFRILPGAMRRRGQLLEQAVEEATGAPVPATAAEQSPVGSVGTRRAPTLADTIGQTPVEAQRVGGPIPDDSTPMHTFTSDLDRARQGGMGLGSVEIEQAQLRNEQRKAASRERLRDRATARLRAQRGDLLAIEEQRIREAESVDELAALLGLSPIQPSATPMPDPRPPAVFPRQGTMLPTPNQDPLRPRPVIDDSPLPPPGPTVPGVPAAEAPTPPRMPTGAQALAPRQPDAGLPPHLQRDQMQQLMEDTLGRPLNPDERAQLEMGYAALQPGPRTQPTADGYELVNPQDIQVDARAYQFKSQTDTRGRNETLKSVDAWNEQAGRQFPVTLHRRRDGSLYVVDGHQRVGLAQDLQARGRDVPSLRAIVLNETDGVTIEQARRIGNMGNILAGTAEPFDIAKVLRGADLDEQEARAIAQVRSDAGEKYRQGQDLAKLGPDAFEYIRQHEIEPRYARLVPRHFAADGEQITALETLRKVGPRSIAEADSYLSKMASAGFGEAGQPDLFGNVQINPLIEKVVRLEADVVAQLSRAKTAFGAAVRNASRLEGEGQTVIDRAAASKAEQQAAKARFLVRKYANQKGTNTNEALREAVQRADAGELTPQQAADLVIEAVERDWNNLPVRQRAAPGVRPDAAGAGPEPLPGLDTSRLFDESGVVSPRIAASLAGGATGGAISGVAPADSPEERARNVIAGTVAGLAGGAALTAAVTRRPKRPTPTTPAPTATTQAPPVGPVRVAGRGTVRGSLSKDRASRGQRVMVSVPEAFAPPPPEKTIRASRLFKVPLEKFPEQSRKAITETLARYGGFAEQRRNVRPHALTEEMAKRMAVELEKSLPPGTALNAEELRAASMVMTNAGARLKDVSQAVQAERARGIQNADSLRQMWQAQTDFDVVLKTFMGARAEAGRALNIQQVINRMMPDEWRVLMTGDLGTKLSKDLERMSELFAQVKDPIEAMKIARAEQDWKPGERLQSYWITNILSGLQTQQRNIFGNAFNLVTRTSMKAAAGGYDAVLSFLQPGRQREVYASEAVQSAVGIVSSLDKAMSDAVDILRDGFSKQALEEMLQDLRTLELGRKEFRGGALNPWNLVGRALDAADRFFYTLNHSAELYGQTYTAARRALAKRNLRPGSEAYQTALAKEMVNQRLSMSITQRRDIMNAALEGVYREKPGPLTAGLLSLKSHAPALGYLIPFVRTVGNLVRQGYEHTPLSLAVKGARRAAGNKDAFGETERQRVLMTTRGLVGSIAMAPLAWMASQGRLSGSGPQDRAERDQLRALGWQPNSFKVPLPDEVATLVGASRSPDGEYWVNYNTFEPLALPMSLVANSFEAWSDLQRQQQTATTEQDISGLMAQTIARVAQSGLDRSYFTGLATLVNAIENPTQGATRAISDLLRGFAPLSGFSRNLQRFADPTLRDPQGFLEELQANVPVLSEQLPARIGRYGEDQQMQGSAFRRGFVVPEVSATQADPVDVELQRLGIFLGVPDRRVAIRDLQGETMQVDRDFVEQVRRGRGQGRRGVLERIIAAPDYDRLTDQQRRFRIERALGSVSRRTGAAARLATRAGNPELFERATAPLRSRAGVTP